MEMATIFWDGGSTLFYVGGFILYIRSDPKFQFGKSMIRIQFEKSQIGYSNFVSDRIPKTKKMKFSKEKS